MGLTQEMRALTQQFTDAHNERLAAVGQMHVDTVAFLGELAHGSQLRCRDMGAMLREFESAREEMAAEQRERLAAEVAETRSDTAALLKKFQSAREETAAEQRERLASAVAEMRSDTAAFVEHLAGESQARCHDVATSLKELKSARQAMAAEQCERLASEVGTIASQVAETRRTLQADLAGARREWRKFARARPRSTGRSEGALPERASADDLTEIKGLGPATQRRLQNAGILSFPQLAGCTPEELRDKLGEAGRRLKVAEWIKQARKLAA